MHESGVDGIVHEAARIDLWHPEPFMNEAIRIGEGFDEQHELHREGADAVDEAGR